MISRESQDEEEDSIEYFLHLIYVTIVAMCFPLDGWHKAPGKSASDDGMNNNESEITYTRYLDFMT